jgi:hypothetical protein
MPFDPRLIQPEPPPLDAQGQIDLPDDLAMLAEQLEDDARHLALCYPACGEKRPPISPGIGQAHEHRGRRLALILGSGLAGSLVACSLLAVTIGLFAIRSWRSTSVAVEPAALVAEGNSDSNIDRRTAFSLEAAEYEANAHWAPAMLRNVSQPELEGLIDLWQNQSPEAATISF